MRTGVILLGHGSRIPEANEHLRQLAEQVGALLKGMSVEACYMVYANPSLSEGVARMVKEGISRIIVAPIFLSNGLHVQQDIPEELRRIRETYPEVELIYTSNLGADRRIAEIIVERILEVAPGGLSAGSQGH